ncbi:hypothetical protein [Streptomyces sp. NPDC055186]
MSLSCARKLKTTQGDDGQFQRACLARALALRSRWLTCDEITARLDASTTAALVTAVEDCHTATSAGLLAVGHDRTARWNTVVASGAPAAEAS